MNWFFLLIAFYADALKNNTQLHRKCNVLCYVKKVGGLKCCYSKSDKTD